MRKMVLIFGSCLSFFFMSCEMSTNKYELPESDQAVNALLGKIAKSIEKKYHIRPSGTNVAMPRKVLKLIGLDFKIQGPLSKEEIRSKLLELSQEFLSIVNYDEEIRPFMHSYPFKIENIQIILFFINSKGYDIDYPDIGIAQISDGELSYLTLITKGDIPSVQSEFKESYEQALAILHKNKELKN